MSKDRKQIIHDVVEDLVAKFMYYDRKEDEQLPAGQIEDAIKEGETSVAEIVSVFEKALRKNF